MTPGTSRTRNSTARSARSTPRGRGPQGTRGRPGRASARRVAGRGRDRGGSRRARLGAAGLSDYMAEQNIARMEDDARTKIDALKLQRTPTTGSSRTASTAEDAASPQDDAYDKEMRRSRRTSASIRRPGRQPTRKVVATPRGERRDLCGGRGGARPVVRRWPAVVHTRRSPRPRPRSRSRRSKPRPSRRWGGRGGVPYIGGERGRVVRAGDRRHDRPTLEGLGGEA